MAEVGTFFFNMEVPYWAVYEKHGLNVEDFCFETIGWG